jgi:hypothetical protein
MWYRQSIIIIFLYYQYILIYWLSKGSNMFDVERLNKNTAQRVWGVANAGHNAVGQANVKEYCSAWNLSRAWSARTF